MSVQFGRWDFEGRPPAADYIEKVSATLAPYGPDTNESYSKGGIKILYRAFHTTNESRREKQPCISPSGAIITWDGRLDNRADLISELCNSLTVNSTDVTIVAATYEKWGTNFLGKLIGDWALSIWNPSERYVLLAKDHIGTKHLYYSFDHSQLTWSTILDPLVLFAGKTFEISEEYIAGWFATRFPAAHLTPYIGIHHVPPSSAVLFRPGEQIVSKFWDFDPSKRIRYRTDAEYEEHFRSVLATSVKRRLRSDRPVLAELSGGMDSSSIVCIADTVIARGAEKCPRFDTISWFDDSYDRIEPDSNELHWITKVEEQCGRTGCHINFRELRSNEVRPQEFFTSEFESDRLVVTPVPSSGQSEFFKRYKACIQSQGHRVTLSGIGGDEATGGGVPSPNPELQNFLVRARFTSLARQLDAWAIKMRRGRLPLLWEAVQGFFSARVEAPRDLLLAPWLCLPFVRRNRTAFYGYPFRVKLFGPLPSFQDHIDKFEGNRRFVASCHLSSELLREVRYPYFDRDFLEFMYAIPREQIVRVGLRRSLMKRALVGIVPDELLKRRRKTFVPPEPKKGSSTKCPSLAEIGHHIIGSSLGIINPDGFREALQNVRCNKEVPIGSLKHTLTLESWLRHLAVQGALKNPILNKETRSFLGSCNEGPPSASSAEKFS